MQGQARIDIAFPSCYIYIGWFTLTSQTQSSLSLSFFKKLKVFMGTENGRRKCGRKKTKSNEGKIPQRGMGVAQLEWHINHQGSDGLSKRETNPNPNPSPNHNPNMFHSYAPQTHPYYLSYFTDQAAVTASRSNGSGSLNQQQGLVVQRLAPNNNLIVGPAGQSSGFGYVYPDQFPVLDQYGVGPQNSYYQANTSGNVNMSCDVSKDMISYVPHMQCCPKVFVEDELNMHLCRTVRPLFKLATCVFFLLILVLDFT